MLQIPSLDWPRRTAPLLGTEDLLKQNPLTDAFPQEERIPTSLISDYTISQILITNVGAGIGVYDFKNGNQIDFRSFAGASNKISVSLNSKTIRIDANPLNIASEINLSDLNDVSSPSTPNTYLMWNGSSYTFNPINPYALTVRDYLNQTINLNSGDTLNLVGSSPILITKLNSDTFITSFNGSLNDLSDVTISGSVPNGFVLTYESSSGQWKPKVAATPSSYSFNVKGDAAPSSTVGSSATLSILGNGSTISTTLSGTNEISIDWNASLSQLSDVSTIPPLNNQVLTYNSTTSKWEPKNSSSSTLTFLNGLTLSGSEVKLGGMLTENTVINGNNYNNSLSVINLKTFKFTTNKTPHFVEFESNENQGLTILKSTNTTSFTTHYLTLDSLNSYSALSTQVGTTARYFYLKTTQQESGVFHEFNGIPNSGVFAKINRLEVLDGVNTPSAGHVLTYMADGSTQFQPASGGGGGGSDNWGTQVVQTDSTLTGDGTLSATLKVTNPVPSGYSNGQYLGVESGNLIWKDFPNGELVGICEIERESDVSIVSGKSFFVVPPQMNSWQLKSYIASVYTLGSGGTTDVEITRNGSTISGSNLSLSSLYGTKTSINASVSTGDIITINVTAAKTTKDKGLSLTLYFAP